MTTTTYGLVTTGFARKPFAAILDDVKSALQTTFGASIDLGDRSVLGQLVGIFVERFALLWELSEAVNSSQDPDAATGASLDALCSLTGTIRPPATSSRVTLTLTGTPTTTVPAGNTASALSTGAKFTTKASGTLVLVPDWAHPVAYTVGTRVTSVARVYQCVLAGTSGAGAPTTTGQGIDDGGAHWDYLGEGTAAVDVAAVSIDTGAIAGTARDITVKETAIGGWDSVINILDAVRGRDVATDSELRALRIAELSASGTSTPDAIRAAILNLPDVTACTVFYNSTDTTDADGMPPHSVEVLVRGGADQNITDAVFANVAAGITTTGTAPTGTAIDSEGTPHSILWSRPDEQDIYVVVNLTDDNSTYAGDASVKSAITDWASGLATGKDVVASAVAGKALDVDGVLDAEALIYTDVIGAASPWTGTHGYVATPGSRSVVTNGGRTYICTTSGTSAGSGGPTSNGTAIADGSVVWRFLGATLPMTLRQLAVYDSGRITINVTDGTP